MQKFSQRRLWSHPWFQPNRAIGVTCTFVSAQEISDCGGYIIYGTPNMNQPGELVLYPRFWGVSDVGIYSIEVKGSQSDSLPFRWTFESQVYACCVPWAMSATAVGLLASANVEAMNDTNNNLILGERLDIFSSSARNGLMRMTDLCSPVVATTHNIPRLAVSWSLPPNARMAPVNRPSGSFGTCHSPL